MIDLDLAFQIFWALIAESRELVILPNLHYHDLSKVW